MSKRSDSASDSVR